MRDFLLEIGMEEVPATQLRPAVDYILSSFETLARDSNLEYAKVQASSSPRRFFLLVFGLQERQEDLAVHKIGPAKKIAFNDAGELLPPALGFLKKNNAKPEDIEIESSARGEFIVLNQIQKGRQTKAILQEWIPSLISRLPFDKTMVWNDSHLALSRPLRWLCVLWGEEIIELEIAGVKSGNFSFGNRWLALDKPLKINSPQSYLDILKDNRVLADRSVRREKLQNELASVELPAGHEIAKDENLTDTNTDLTESPSAVVAEFSPEFLSLPQRIISSTISQNQKYYWVRDAEGKLSNSFVFVSNGDPASAELIRKGNEKVVSARLSDALWYFEEDTKKPLEEWLPQLEEVVFQSQLGSMADKTKRIIQIAEHICQKLGLDEKTTELTLRAAKLCKTDLVTNMLGEKEFTRLQGYIGQQYALAAGENPDVAQAIGEHYQPRGPNDTLPESVIGAVLAVADKLDSVSGIIGIGQAPTGSADPFALRRAANGVVQIIVQRNWNLDFSEILDFCLGLINKQTQTVPSAAADLQAFFTQRVHWLLSQLKLDYDVIDSLKHLSLGNLSDLKNRGLALQSYRGRDDFLRLVIGFKRVANIINEEDDLPLLDESLFEEAPESELHAGLKSLHTQIDASLNKNDYHEAIASLVEYGASIDVFFDAVLVNCENPALRKNRQALLRDVKKEFLRVADISKLVIDNENVRNIENNGHNHRT
ncbi:MAG: glycine--tRNA ligase subunit beta [Candidatus Cloacimonadaceae bacterium]|jgi:glycyl-tRNA synthetase beta chain|nr:glycine--tRNA ligase subunit beta [Candidatus Cloacimonadota bacterium]MDX9950404.1 glycine--tRNA ligase subunit beta [Candidatus Syntrophosphaera sp.]